MSSGLQGTFCIVLGGVGEVGGEQERVVRKVMAEKQHSWGFHVYILLD